MKRVFTSLFCLITFALVTHGQPTLYGLTYDGGAVRTGTIVKYQGGANTLSAVQNFQSIDYYAGTLIRALDGKLYGMTANGGSYGYGTVFSFDPSSGLYAVLKNFDGTAGAAPYGSLIQTSDGTLYGMTAAGGSGGNGVLFSVTTSGTYAVLKNFDGTTGANPYGSLIQASDGKLYGMTFNGGSNNMGVAFSFDLSSTTYAVLKNFDGTTGNNPTGSLVQASDGVLYGMAREGGSGGRGVVFSLSTSGTYAVLVNFDGTNGAAPGGNLIQASNGTLYGMTSQGGSSNIGVVFSLTTDGTYAVLKNFDGTTGSYPYGSLIQGSDGVLYGFTQTGGSDQYSGVAFSLTTAGSFAVLKNFIGATGANPQGSLVQVPDGTFYGTTAGGGSGYGVLYSLTTSGSYAVVKDLGANTLGSYARGSLVKAADGKLYGMTGEGGSSGYGVVFSFDPSSGTYGVLKNFDGATGRYPYGSLIQASDGTLYGMTPYGGTDNNGVAFSLTTSGTYAVLKNFDGTTGSNPTGSLVQASDGKLYGMTPAGGSNGYGVLFSLTTSGTYAVLKNFDLATDGAFPQNSLMQASDGKLYGMTANGGSNGFGTIFSFDPSSGTYAVLKNFDGTTGVSPTSNLIQASDGKLYGTTPAGGTDNLGVVFSYDLSAATYAVLKNFDGPTGGSPRGSLMQASDGKLYGMTNYGGIDNNGVAFSYDLSSATYAVLKNFDGTTGTHPTGAFTEFVQNLACGNATAFSTTAITATSAMLKWTAPTNPVQWQVQYKTTASGSKWMDVAGVQPSDRSKTITGLKAKQSYIWHIRAKCGKTWTAYSNSVSFKTGSATLSLSNAITATEKIIGETDGLHVQVLSNPTTTYFTLVIQSNRSTPLTLRMADGVGRIVEGKTGIAANSTLRIGSNYQPGIYFAQVLQGSEMVTFKLIKQ